MPQEAIGEREQDRAGRPWRSGSTGEHEEQVAGRRLGPAARPCTCRARIRSERAQTKPPSHMYDAPLGQRDVQQRSTQPECFQRYDTMEVAAFPRSARTPPLVMLRFLSIRISPSSSSVEVEFDAGLNVLTGETGAGNRFSSRPSACCSAGARRAISCGPAKTLATIQAIFETPTGRSSSSAASHGAGPQPRVRQRRAGDRRRAARCRAADRAARPARASGAARSGEPPRRARRVRRPRRDRAPRSAAAFATARAREPSCDALAARRAREGGAHRSARRSSSTRSTKAGAAAGRGRRARGRAPGARERRALQRLSGEAYGALYDGDGAALARWRRSGSGSASSRRSTRVAPYPRSARRRSSRSSRTSRSSSATTPTGSMRRPERLQEVEDRLALLERLKRQVRAALRTSSRTRERCVRELDGVWRGGRARRRRRARLAAARSATSRSRARALSRRRAAARRGSPARSRRRSPSSRWTRTRFDVRFETPTASRSAWTRSAASTARSSSSRRTPARISVRWRASRRAASCRG